MIILICGDNVRLQTVLITHLITSHSGAIYYFCIETFVCRSQLSHLQTRTFRTGWWITFPLYSSYYEMLDVVSILMRKDTPPCQLRCWVRVWSV